MGKLHDSFYQNDPFCQAPHFFLSMKKKKEQT